MSITPIKREKDAIRKEFSSKRDSIPAQTRELYSEKICNYAKGLISFRHADIILLYAPIKSEIDILPLAKFALESGKRIAFPRCNTENRTMKFHFISSFDDFEIGAYGIREPKAHLPVYDPEKTSGVAICFVPGIAFDVYGYRLGYGKGYYDKFLNVFKGSTIGFAFSDLITDKLPRGRFDLHCDIMITENGIKQIKIEK
ncbi:MAG: 5-formyltetrahydrofolate cyclo-ligase [Clostridia bacterium]|nr:5-formyltetrahydrofolate cyclo-ligase [Clostridia bacterium]